MANKLISVIVPVYNVSDYLKECLDSILEQSYSNFELLLVDDGSTDISGRICDDYASMDTRIKVIHKVNGGLSSARNAGLETTQGDYICFVDSDDFIHKDYLKRMYEALEHSTADIAFCDIDSPKLADPSKIYSNNIRISHKESLEWLSDHKSREYVQMVVAWNKIYTRDAIIRLRYQVGRLHEDEFLINDLIKNKNTFMLVPEKLYFYRDNTDGITGSGNEADVRHLDVIDAYDERIQWAINEDKSFTALTTKNCFYKLVEFYKMGGNISAEAEKKYRMMYKKYNYLIPLKQKIKFKIQIFCRRILRV